MGYLCYTHSFLKPNISFIADNDISDAGMYDTSNKYITISHLLISNTKFDYDAFLKNISEN